MSRRNFDAERERQRIRRRGVEGARGQIPIMAPLLPGRRPRERRSKADLRAEAEKAFAAWRAPGGRDGG